MHNSTTLVLKLPRDTQVSPETAKTFLSSLVGINKYSLSHKLLGKANKNLCLQIVSRNQQIFFQIKVDSALTPFIQSQLQSAYPLVSFEKIKGFENEKALKNISLILKNGDYYPIKTYVGFKEVDPLSSILSVLSKANKDDLIIINFSLKSISNSWQANAINFANHGTKKEDGTYIPRPDKNIIEDKVKEDGFKVSVNLLSNNENLLTQLAQSFNVFSNPNGNSFVKKGLLKASSNILNIEELASIWHLPSEKIKTSSISWQESVLSDPPQNLPASDENENLDVNFFAKTIFKNKETIFGIKDADRRRHIWVIGKTGTGKSTLIANLAIDDIRKNHGLAVIDPHGDLSEVLLKFIPKSRINDVIYFNPADKTFPIAINPLEVTNKDEAEFVVSGIIAIFSKIFGKFWGPRLEYVLRNALLTLTEVPGSTLIDVPLILTDRNFRKKIVDKMEDQVLKNFWVNEYENLPPNLQKEVIFPILNKIGQFVTSPVIRNVISHSKSSFDFEEVINGGKILIANLSQGKMGEDNAQLMGAMLITKLQLAAMRRVHVEEENRKDFYLYVDEFQNFATDSFIKILSEARKYRLNLMLANQYIAQIPSQVQKAILGNAGTLIAFSAGAEDARLLSHEFAGVFTEDNLINLENYQIALRLMVGGMGQRPFLAKTLPLPKMENNNKEKIILVSRERWGKKAKDLV